MVVAPGVVITFPAQPNTVTPGQEIVKGEGRIRRQVLKDTRNNEVSDAIYTHNFAHRFFGSKKTLCHFFGEHYIFRAIHRSVCLAFQHWELKDPQEAAVTESPLAID